MSRINSSVTYGVISLKRCYLRSKSSFTPYSIAFSFIAGYCYAHAWKERAAYRHTLETTVYLASEYQGKGIGKQLMQTLINECRHRGYHALIACITEGNEASNSLHQKLGFKQVSHFEKVGLKFDRWLDVFDYELILTPESPVN